jgi:[acyl-carrier-protein] S-malonyltransferase
VRTAFVFPGQGSHRPGALDAWREHPAAEVLDDVAAGVGRDVLALSEDPATARRTADAQPAILAASIVAWRALTEAGVRPDVVAGHSLGEATAAIAAGTLSVRDGAALVAARAAAMGAACREQPGAMAAVVKLGRDAVEVLVDRVDDVVIANDNAPGQVVVAGTPEGIAALRAEARQAGGRVLPLDVEGAFHSAAMASAVAAVGAALERLPLRDPQIPLVSGTSAATVRSGDELATALVTGVVAPVRWREVQTRLVELGVTDLIEVGPGGVLSTLAKRSVPEVTVHTVASPDDVDPVLDLLAPVGALR